MGKLQAAIALLPGAELSNRLAAVALAAHAASRGRLRWPRLPPHLSLEQPFAVESLAALERAVERVAGELAPVQVTLGALEVQPPSPGSPEAVVWVGVDVGPSLLQVEQRVAGALSVAAAVSAAAAVSLAAKEGAAAPGATHVAISPAATNAAMLPAATEVAVPSVNTAHRFHVTLGFLPAARPWQEPGEEALLPALAGTTATFPELGVFVYDGLLLDGRPRAGWQCMLLARLPLGASSHNRGPR